MRVVIARISGFCHGVKRAMAVAVNVSARYGGLVADGPLVHNRQAIALLELHGVASAPAEDAALPVLIRAHGIPPERRQRWLEQGRELVDGTCVHVARNQRLAADAAGRGMVVALAGDADHAEVRAVAASAGERCHIVGSVDDVVAIPAGGKVFLLAQTTFDAALFHAMASAMRARFPDCEVADTICRATGDRQKEAARLARLVDAMVVVGGRNSANSRRLADIAAQAGTPVFPVETADELREEDFKGCGRVGVISGASTPGWITQEVINRLRPMGRRTMLGCTLVLLQALVLTRLSTALSAAGLALAMGLYLTGVLDPVTAVAGGCYVFFAHTLNRRIPNHPEARRLSLVDAFYQQRRARLLTVAWVSLAVALAVMVRQGMASFLFYLFLCGATVAYAGLQRAATALPRVRTSTLPRTFFMAAGWALALTVPFWGQSLGMTARARAAAFVFLICLGGSLVSDLQDIASDSLMGMNTLPAQWGVRTARWLDRTAFAAAGSLCFLAAAHAAVHGPVEVVALCLLLPLVPAAGLLMDFLLARGVVRDAMLLQAGIDGMGCLAGALAVAFGECP